MKTMHAENKKHFPKGGELINNEVYYGFRKNGPKRIEILLILDMKVNY